MKINCVIIDDEPPARMLLSNYLDRIDFLENIGEYSSPVAALKDIKNKRVDVVFLDIQMPEMTGIEFLNALSRQPRVIFSTAYEDYALESYDYDAVDYLLKPFTFNRFLQSIDKLTSRLVSSADYLEKKQDKKDKQDYIFVNVSGEITRLPVKSIKCIQGYNDYIMIESDENKYLIRDNLKNAEALLEPNGFIRVHRSYIVPANGIESIKGNNILVYGREIPIGKLYRNALMAEINKMRLG